MKTQVSMMTGGVVLPEAKPITQDELARLAEAEEAMDKAVSAYKTLEASLRGRALLHVPIQQGMTRGSFTGGLEDNGRASVTWKDEYIAVAGLPMAEKLMAEAKASKKPSWKFWVRRVE